MFLLECVKSFASKLGIYGLGHSGQTPCPLQGYGARNELKDQTPQIVCIW